MSCYCCMLQLREIIDTNGAKLEGRIVTKAYQCFRAKAATD